MRKNLEEISNVRFMFWLSSANVAESDKVTEASAALYFRITGFEAETFFIFGCGGESQTRSYAYINFLLAKEYQFSI